jgi:disulfide bond formation protein DsbB
MGLSVLSLATALTLEYVGYRPCPLCLEERIPYYASVPIALIAFLLARPMPWVSRILLGLISLAFIYNTWLGAFHAGVEWHWWPGPDECSGISPLTSSGSELLNKLNNGIAGVVRCDEAPIRILGISLAGYGAMLSFFLALLAAIASAGWLSVLGVFWRRNS